MKTIIESNGSTWMGESPMDLEVLFQRLETNTLDPIFEKYGDFVLPQDDGAVIFFGNFLDYSHVFTIVTTDPDLIERLTNAIRANQGKDSYKQGNKRA